MKSLPEDSPQIAIKFANTVFILCFMFSVLISVYALYRIFNPMYASSIGVKEIKTFYIIFILCGGLLATLFILGLKKLSNNLKINLSISIFVIGICVYGIETYLELKTNRAFIAKISGVPFDTRSRMEVLNDLRNSGVEAFPNIFPFMLVGSNGLMYKKNRIYPLGGISNSTTFFSNEGGYYPIFKTDKHGFNNPKGLYVENEVDIVLIGDSSTAGKSVHTNETMGGVLRQSDLNAISLGKRGSGPLAELGSLKEYAEPLKPKIVLWVYCPNDLENELGVRSDLDQELDSSILRSYLEQNNYSQNLISRQEEVDFALKDYAIQREKMQIEREKRETLPNNFLIKIIKLYNLRNLFNLKLESKTLSTSRPLSITQPIFRDILKKSNQMISDWNGKLYFVYLPSFQSYYMDDTSRDFVMQTAMELDIPIIDILEEVFVPHPDPITLFPFKMQGHFNAEGYKLTAEVIIKRLKEDGYQPIVK